MLILFPSKKKQQQTKNKKKNTASPLSNKRPWCRLPAVVYCPLWVTISMAHRAQRRMRSVRAGAATPWFRLSILGSVAVGEQASRPSGQWMFPQCLVNYRNGIRAGRKHGRASLGKVRCLVFLSEHISQNCWGYSTALKSGESTSEQRQTPRAGEPTNFSHCSQQPAYYGAAPRMVSPCRGSERLFGSPPLRLSR